MKRNHVIVRSASRQIVFFRVETNIGQTLAEIKSAADALAKEIGGTVQIFRK